ncbi:MAG: pilus assembly protein N-terminal domain-containing protein, partial [Pirellulales bacterium]
MWSSWAQAGERTRRGTQRGRIAASVVVLLSAGAGAWAVESARGPAPLGQPATGAQIGLQAAPVNTGGLRLPTAPGRPGLLPASVGDARPLAPAAAPHSQIRFIPSEVARDPLAAQSEGQPVAYYPQAEAGSPAGESAVRLVAQTEGQPPVQPEAAPADPGLPSSSPAPATGPYAIEPDVLAPESLGPGAQPMPGNMGPPPGHGYPPPGPHGPPHGFMPPDDNVITPFQVIDYSEELTVTMRRSKLLRFPNDIFRVAVADPSICNVNLYTKRDVGLIGLNQGATTVTFWFDDGQFQPRTFLVRVQPDPEVQKRREEQYQMLEQILAQQFPNSKVRLKPRANKLFVEGQAKDSEEAAQILSILRNDAMGGWGANALFGGGVNGGMAADPLNTEEAGRRLPPAQIINLLRVPGIQQVALRVKVAELNRSAARNFGIDLDMHIDFSDGQVVVRSLLNALSGSTATVLSSFDNNKINVGLHYLQQQGVIKLLSEPTVVTMSGYPASFQAGGEFAVPTTVGVGGAAAVTTDFRAYGTIVTVLPSVLDKDRVRLQVAPEFSQINSDMSVNGIPSLNTRAVRTTVEMREGQTLAIGGLLSDSMTANSKGTIPFINNIIGRRSITRSETELIILVTPELVQPM